MMCEAHCFGFERKLVKNLEPKMSFVVTAKTRTHRVIFEVVSIIPSIRSACTMVPITITSAKNRCAVRQFWARSFNRLRKSAKPVVAKSDHMAMTPQFEKGVGEEKVRASITSGGLVSHSPPT